MLRVAGEDEVRCRRQHFEAFALQLFDQRLATFDDLVAGRLEVLAVLESCRTTHIGHTVQRIGVEAVLDPLQRFDQIRMPHRQADTQTGQRARL